MLFNKVFLGVFILCFFILSCKKKKSEKNEQVSSVSEGYLVLNEGLFNQNNASLTWYDLKTRNVTLDVFQANNQRGLGDTGNDMIRFGTYTTSRATMKNTDAYRVLFPIPTTALLNPNIKQNPGY